MYDLAILGGGPAGVAAGVYASRKQLKTVFITKDFGGQSIVSDGIENWIGTVKISGADLAKSLEEHLRAYAEDIVDIQTGQLVDHVEKIDGGFKVVTNTGNEFEAKTVLIGTGSKRRKLAATGADEFEHKGVTYCATCDGPMFSGKDVVVVGGGNAGFESAAQLAAYANSVTILHRNDSYRADPVTVEAVLAHPKVTGVLNADTTEVHGDKFVDGLTYKDKESGEETKLDVQGVFVEIGAIPATDFVGDLVKRLPSGHVEIDPWNQRTSVDGIWAAGDCTNVLYHQNNIAAGDAVKALEDIYLFINAK